VPGAPSCAVGEERAPLPVDLERRAGGVAVDQLGRRRGRRADERGGGEGEQRQSPEGEHLEIAIGLGRPDLIP